MRLSLRADFSNATDLADDLVQKGLSFREAHEVVGFLVKRCLKLKIGLEDLSLAQLSESHALFDSTSLMKVSHDAVMRARNSDGGTSPKAVLAQILKAERSIGLNWLRAREIQRVKPIVCFCMSQEEEA